MLSLLVIPFNIPFLVVYCKQGRAGGEMNRLKRRFTMYTANPDRYETMQYKRVGRSGLKLPYVSLGLWRL